MSKLDKLIKEAYRGKIDIPYDMEQRLDRIKKFRRKHPDEKVPFNIVKNRKERVSKKLRKRAEKDEWLS